MVLRQKDPEQRTYAIDRTLADLRNRFGDACWLWPKFRDRDGYGRAFFRGSTWLAHRASYESLVGPIPDGLTLDHLCRTRACVNPEHLEPVTRGENLLRGETLQGINSRKTRCVNGHEFTPENTYVTRSGHRACRACGRISVRRRNLRRKEGYQ